MNKLLTIFFKEMKDVLRDRRTLLVMVVLPMIIMPIAFNLILNLIAKQSEKARVEVLKIAILNADALPELAAEFNDGNRFEVVAFEGGESDLKPAIQSGQIKIGLVFPENAQDLIASQRQLEITTYYNNASITSMAFSRTRDVIRDFNDNVRHDRLKGLGLTSRLDRDSIIEPATIREAGVSDMREILGERVGGFLPYLFIAFCFIGALYPAIDIGAGEKERGTLETLLLTPVPRRHLVLGKFLVVFTTGILTAVLCLCSVGILIAIKGKEMTSEIGKIIASISPLDLTLIGTMLVPLAATFAAILLLVSIYSRNFKEAQSYISPFSFLAVMPAIVAMLPGIELNWKWAMFPIANIALAIKELAKGTIDYSLLGLMFGSTALLAGISIFLCVHWFQKESVLFRD